LVAVHGCTARHPLVDIWVRPNDLESFSSKAELELDSEWRMVRIQMSDHNGRGLD
jgi:hypothetical protein